jgi:hypothetical protein
MSEWGFVSGAFWYVWDAVMEFGIYEAFRYDDF